MLHRMYRSLTDPGADVLGLCFFFFLTFDAFGFVLISKKFTFCKYAIRKGVFSKRFLSKNIRLIISGSFNADYYLQDFRESSGANKLHIAFNSSLQHSRQRICCSVFQSIIFRHFVHFSIYTL